MARRKAENAIDWDLVEQAYRKSLKPMRQIAAEFGIETSSISRKAKRGGWNREVVDQEADRSRAVKVDDQGSVDEPGFVYAVFFEADGRRLYKVGMAKSPEMRLSTHQTSIPFDLSIACAYFVGNTRREEQILHRMFADKLVRGEWFELDGADLDRMAMRSRLA